MRLKIEKNRWFDSYVLLKLINNETVNASKPTTDTHSDGLSTYQPTLETNKSQTHKVIERIPSKSSLFLSSGISSLLGLLLFNIGGEELLVLSSSSFGVLPSALSLLSDDTLSAETFLSDETLDLGWLEESLVSALDLTTNNVLAHIILLLVESEGLDNVVAALLAESVGALNIGNTFDFLVALLHNSQEESSNIGTDNAATAGLAGAFTSTAGSVAGTTYSRKVLSTLLKLLLNICDLEQKTLHTNTRLEKYLRFL